MGSIRSSGAGQSGQVTSDVTDDVTYRPVDMCVPVGPIFNFITGWLVQCSHTRALTHLLSTDQRSAVVAVCCCWLVRLTFRQG